MEYKSKYSQNKPRQASNNLDSISSSLPHKRKLTHQVSQIRKTQCSYCFSVANNHQSSPRVLLRGTDRGPTLSPESELLVWPVLGKSARDLRQSSSHSQQPSTTNPQPIAGQTASSAVCSLWLKSVVKTGKLTHILEPVSEFLPTLFFPL